MNKWARKFLKKKAQEHEVNMDNKLLDHFASLFVRDNLCVFKGTLDHEINLNETKLFEAIQSSNWNDVRFKPPPSMDSSIGWRVEFRSMDVQLTSELTFLFCHSVQVLSRMLIKLHDEINFYIPISLVDENFRRANKVNAAIEQKFFFRTNLFENGKPQIEELTLKEIFNGKVRTNHEGIICRLVEGHRYLFDEICRRDHSGIQCQQCYAKQTSQINFPIPCRPGIRQGSNYGLLHSKNDHGSSSLQGRFSSLRSKTS